jgi:hypothetical protein
MIQFVNPCQKSFLGGWNGLENTIFVSRHGASL